METDMQALIMELLLGHVTTILLVGLLALLLPALGGLLTSRR